MVDCAIVGCGLIAGGYDNVEDDLVRTHAKAFYGSQECRLVGVCDTDTAVAREFSDIWHADFAFSETADLFERCDVDLLSICSPTQTHEDIFRQACERGVETIWLEKPAASSVDAVLRMNDLARRSKVRVWVNYFRRYDAGFRKVKAELAKLGEIRHVRAVYTKGLRHNGSHMIDLVHWLFGAVSEVVARDIFDDKSFPSLTARLKTELATVDLVALDYRDYEMFEVDIFCKGGRIRILDGGQVINFDRLVEAKYYSGYRNLSLEETHKGSYGSFMRAGLARGLSGGEMPGLKEELAIQEVLDRCSQAAGFQF